MDIKILIDEGGIFQGLYVSPELKEADVELLDFVTDDPGEIDDVTNRKAVADEREKQGSLVFLSY